MSKHYNNKKRGAKGGLSLATDHRMSLAGFRSTEQPDLVAIKQVYSDFRTMTASTNQAEYVYRLNSLFDPDQTGVGGQPDGFDQWKTLYTNYRVVACGVEVEAVGGNGFGLLAIAPTVTSTTISSAEEVAGLRHAKSQVFTTTQRAKVKALYHIGEVFGWPDETVLATDSCSAACTTNPTSVAFVHVAAETSGASDIVYFRILLTYYARFEVPTVLIDSVDSHRRKFALIVKGASTISSAALMSTNTDTQIAVAAASVLSDRAPPTALAVQRPRAGVARAIVSDSLPRRFLTGDSQGDPPESFRPSLSHDNPDEGGAANEVSQLAGDASSFVSSRKFGTGCGKESCLGCARAVETRR